MIKIVNRNREIRPSWMKVGNCGNVGHGLASFCHEAGNGGNKGRRCPKHVRTVFLSDLDSKKRWVKRKVRKEETYYVSLRGGQWSDGDGKTHASFELVQCPR